MTPRSAAIALATLSRPRLLTFPAKAGTISTELKSAVLRVGLQNFSTRFRSESNLHRHLPFWGSPSRSFPPCIHCHTHLTWLGVAPGTWSNSSAAAPATMGAAKLVPDMTV